MNERAGAMREMLKSLREIVGHPAFPAGVTVGIPLGVLLSALLLWIAP